MRNWRKTGKIFLHCVLGMILLLNIVIICLERIKGPEALEKVPYALLTIEGSSMEPGYHDGDGVFVRQAPYKSLKTGDVIVFLQAGELITHQVIAVNNGVITAKGTANSVADEPVTIENYRAKVLFRIPDMANIQAVFKQPMSFLVFAILLGVFLFGKEIFSKIYDTFS